MTTKYFPVLDRFTAVFKPRPDEAPVMTTSSRLPILIPPKTLGLSLSSFEYNLPMGFSYSVTDPVVAERMTLEIEGVVVVVDVVVRMTRCEGAKAPAAEAVRNRVRMRIIAGCIIVLKYKVLKALSDGVTGRVVGP
jgi:hypothetical protein